MSESHGGVRNFEDPTPHPPPQESPVMHCTAMTGARSESETEAKETSFFLNLAAMKRRIEVMIRFFCCLLCNYSFFHKFNFPKSFSFNDSLVSDSLSVCYLFHLNFCPPLSFLCRTGCFGLLLKEVRILNHWKGRFWWSKTSTINEGARGFRKVAGIFFCHFEKESIDESIDNRRVFNSAP